ncbi:hypothetical protein ACPCHT_19020 [Nucisporomicrobium flavum]|uniref:hypothetical protein n=1 Tax=Nucisporomicrobium flavum TaxID=2785915 RepID=UPI003C2FA13B
MTVTADLPAPGPMWHRWATLAAALTALGFDDTWTVDETGAHHDDGGGNWSHLTLVEAGRAVLYGYDHEYSDTTYEEPPIDLLADAPAWVPWDDLLRHAGQDQLGYALWYDDGHWSRAAYPEGVNDGLTATAGPVLTDEAARAELIGIVFAWGKHPADTPTERARIATVADRLLLRFDEESLQALLDDLPTFDAYAGHAVARRAGLLPGTVVPVSAEGTRPPRRTVRKLSETEHDRLIWSAMHTEPERNRPAPVPTGELGALMTWLRTHAPAGDGRCSLLAYADNTTVSARHGNHPPADNPDEGSLGTFRDLSTLIRNLRQAEADDAYGSWLFVRIETTAAEVTVERFYDSWPSWWEDNGRSGPWRSHLRAEIDGRSQEWKPSWAGLLLPEVAYRPVE